MVIRMAGGAALGVVTAVFVMRALTGMQEFAGEVWLFAPLGASALLMFVMPSSPVARPWAVIGGNTVAVMVGAVCAVLMPHPMWLQPGPVSSRRAYSSNSGSTGAGENTPSSGLRTNNNPVPTPK